MSVHDHFDHYDHLNHDDHRVPDDYHNYDEESLAQIDIHESLTHSLNQLDMQG